MLFILVKHAKNFCLFSHQKLPYCYLFLWDLIYMIIFKKGCTTCIDKGIAEINDAKFNAIIKTK